MPSSCSPSFGHQLRLIAMLTWNEEATLTEEMTPTSVFSIIIKTTGRPLQSSLPSALTLDLLTDRGLCSQQTAAHVVSSAWGRSATATRSAYPMPERKPPTPQPSSSPSSKPSNALTVWPIDVEGLSFCVMLGEPWIMFDMRVWEGWWMQLSSVIWERGAQLSVGGTIRYQRNMPLMHGVIHTWIKQYI